MRHLLGSHESIVTGGDTHKKQRKRCIKFVKNRTFSVGLTCTLTLQACGQANTFCVNGWCRPGQRSLLSIRLLGSPLIAATRAMGVQLQPHPLIAASTVFCGAATAPSFAPRPTQRPLNTKNNIIGDYKITFACNITIRRGRVTGRQRI